MPLLQLQISQMGEYLMQGTYNKKTGELKLGGVGWLNRPKHYDMVPLSGKLAAQGKLLLEELSFKPVRSLPCKERRHQREHPLVGPGKGLMNVLKAQLV
jgi:hypothetical protein